MLTERTLSNSSKSSNRSKRIIRPRPPKTKKLNKSDKSDRSTGGVNLTPLISALLLAGIKLSLEQNKKTKKVASNRKSTNTKPRRRTI